ncbi:protein of unknown function (DUF4154) [Mariprofundus ferrinatatus]|uniref:YfiR family protein n=2 Tax=Mariprofundus ferrinatatus TaxID=1921087 RepID=A0A2K8L1T7_9PROT|nr:protein of unknown function (DUF4154) [Mariprofundus ferrinatatus]
MALPATSFATDQIKARADDLKSVYIFNFIRFTEWPENDSGQGDSATTLNILNNDRILEILEAIAAKPAGRQVGLKLQSCKDEACIQGSSVLYIGESEWSGLDPLLKLVDGRPILTISDIPGFAERGGMIEIKYHNEKLTFAVNLQAVERAGLYISAQLLQLGDVVGRKNE